MTARKPPLRVATEADAAAAEAATQRKPMTIAQAAESGDRLDELKAMRLRLARALDDANTPARDLAALSRRQMEIGREIESLEREAEEDAREHEATPDDAWDASAI